MEVIIRIVFCLFIVGIVELGVSILFDPENYLFHYFFSWKYRMMLRIRHEYIWGLKRTHPDDYQYFYDGATNLIWNSLIAHKRLDYSVEARELTKMLQVEQFIHHYFVDEGLLSVNVFNRMCEDYRSGIYCTRDYNPVEHLKRILPIEITSNEKAFSDFLKFVNAGWFDFEGMYIITGTRNLQHIGRAVYWICKNNQIPAPEKVFGPFWNVEQSKILDWKRNNKNQDITDAIDKKVSAILE